ncbi:MAG: TlpA disulfide reductase family protein [Pyrinomonadaceae bacterium]|nr:TlpA disulfide reductase family protein [Pyrinomonadaceae bacterium]
MKIFKKITSIFSVVALSAVFAAAQTNLTSIDGRTVDIEGQNGKVVILAIGASWLQLSDKQAEYTNALAKKYAGKNVVVYFVATDSTNGKSKNYATNDTLQKFATENKLSVPVLRDSEGSATFKKFAIDQVPSFVVLDKQGNRSGNIFGGIDPKFDITVPISKQVDKLL